jgi:hypothetical protein
MRLLLVEDDRMIGESLQRALRLEGYAVDWVRDAATADGALASERFDLVLVTLKPLADGLEQRGDRFLVGLFRISKPLLGALEELLLRFREDVAAGGLELRKHVLARLAHQLELLVEVLRVGLERRVLDLRVAELLDRALELLVALRGLARRGDPADRQAERERHDDK